MYSFKGFTQKANKALNLAINTAEQLGHTYIGTEHILCGLLEEGSGVAATALTNSGASFEKLVQSIKTEIGAGSPTSLTPEDFTPRTKRILQTAVVKAASMNHNYVGT